MKRRKFITVFGAATLAAPVAGTLTSFTPAEKKFEGHVFPELGYAFNALEPYIDAQTMELHYTKHHKGYYTKFMNAIDGTKMMQTPLEDIFAKISKHSEGIRNNGGGYYNHTLFWENMTPKPGEIPGPLKTALEKNFGSVEKFKEKFGNAAKTRFGSGWAWLALDDKGKMFVSSTPNQDNPLMDVVEDRGTPLLALDVWEHAYYLHYQNRRAEYVDNFWNIVNWKVVQNRLEAALK